MWGCDMRGVVGGGQEDLNPAAATAAVVAVPVRRRPCVPLLSPSLSMPECNSRTGAIPTQLPTATMVERRRGAAAALGWCQHAGTQACARAARAICGAPFHPADSIKLIKRAPAAPGRDSGGPLGLLARV